MSTLQEEGHWGFQCRDRPKTYGGAPAAALATASGQAPADGAAKFVTAVPSGDDVSISELLRDPGVSLTVDMLSVPASAKLLIAVRDASTPAVAAEALSTLSLPRTTIEESELVTVKHQPAEDYDSESHVSDDSDSVMNTPLAQPRALPRSGNAANQDLAAAIERQLSEMLAMSARVAHEPGQSPPGILPSHSLSPPP